MLAAVSVALSGASSEPGREASWVPSYRAEGPLLELDGARVVATGRACDARGEAIDGEHFNLETLRRAAPAK